MDTPIFTLENLRKSYEGRDVVDVDHLEVRQGEVLTLVGPSGTGKSTLLRLLNFLEPATAGTVAYRGRTFVGNRAPGAVRREITTVFQRPVLIRGSVRRNLAYGLRLRGQRDDRRVAQMLTRVRMDALSRTPAQRLSGGEMQRVALARALVVQPTVLLLDEPTANLEPYNVALIEEIVHGENRQSGTTVVLVTHNVFQAKRLAPRRPNGCLRTRRNDLLNQSFSANDQPSGKRLGRK